MTTTSEPASQAEPAQAQAGEKPAREPWVEVASDAAGWHWVLWAGNGQPLAKSARPYASRQQVIAAIQTAQVNFACAKVVAVVR